MGRRELVSCLVGRLEDGGRWMVDGEGGEGMVHCEGG